MPLIFLYMDGKLTCQRVQAGHVIDLRGGVADYVPSDGDFASMSKDELLFLLQTSQAAVMDETAKKMKSATKEKLQKTVKHYWPNIKATLLKCMKEQDRSNPSPNPSPNPSTIM